MTIQLINPTIELEKAYLDFYNEWLIAGEKISPGILRKMTTVRFEEMVHVLQDLEFSNHLREGDVPQSVFWLVNKKNRILGAVTIRHSLTERMLNTEGHIGLGIRPSERKKGYATKMLELALGKMREMGFHRALITCNEDNIGSEKVIVNNGGIRDEDFLEPHGNIVRRYWITL